MHRKKQSFRRIKKEHNQETVQEYKKYKRKAKREVAKANTGKGKETSRNAAAIGIKLLEHGMKIYDRTLDRRLRKIIELDGTQVGFMPGKRMTDAIFILRQKQEKVFGGEQDDVHSLRGPWRMPLIEFREICCYGA